MSDRESPFYISLILLAIAVCLLAISVPIATRAQSFGDGDEGNGIQTSASTKPLLLQGVDFQQHIGSEIPLDDTFTDETGATVSLRDYFGKVPVVLILAYYRCPMLCDRVMSGATAALKQVGFHVGDQFRLLTVSFDPKDTPADAAKKKQQFMQQWGDPKAVDGWHFLTGKEEQIQELTNSVGFHYNYDPRTGMFAHSAGLVVLTPGGKLSKYFYGVTFSDRDLRLALVQSSQEKIGSISDQILLFCCTYDPGTGQYHALVSRVLKVGAILTILLIAGGLFLLSRMDLTGKGGGGATPAHS
jgi:protein SCO1/2